MSDSQRPHRALSDALERGDLETIQALLEAHPELVNHPGWTPSPLHCAVLWNQPEAAELLLAHGADIELRDPDRQTTALRYAILYCRAPLIPVLLAHGARTDAIDEGGYTALQLAERAAAGEYEVYDDLPSRDAYLPIVDVLRRCGVTE